MTRAGREDRLVLVLVPTLLLLKQSRTVWGKHARHDFIDLAVCSDVDVMGRDDWTLHADELGVRVTTDPANFAAFLSTIFRTARGERFEGDVHLEQGRGLPGVLTIKGLRLTAFAKGTGPAPRPTASPRRRTGRSCGAGPWRKGSLSMGPASDG